QNIGALLMPYNFNFETLLIAFKQSTTDAHAKKSIHDFIYAISKIRKQELDELADAISTLNTPMSRANNYAIFLVLRLFPELMEELLFNEITTSESKP
ncbi:MAG: hypothetical protein PHR87_10780, partial [Sulfurospirillaceae bacterium]|nr:hypothetical protein [Sulfurospirillaceae bacterium]